MTAPIKYTPFDGELLLRDVERIEVEWREQYSNHPRMVILLKDDVSFSYFQGVSTGGVTFNLYNELPLTGGNIYYSDHPMGWVKYFTHKGNPDVNEGGYGGSPFGVMLHDGTEKILRGPWSSRAECVNIAVEQNPEHTVMDVTVKPGGGGYGLIGTAIKTQAMKFLCEHFKFPYHIIRPEKAFRTSPRFGREQRNMLEKEAWTVSLHPDRFEKPGGRLAIGWDDVEGWEVLYSPEQETSDER